MARGFPAFLEELVADAEFLAKYPYYAAILARLHPVDDPAVDTMGLSLHGGKFYLHANVDALASEPRFLRGILLHEVHHLVLGHLTDDSILALEKKEIAQIAMEVSANEYIDEPLPMPILVEHFARFGVAAGQSTLERYALLCKAEAEAQSPMPRPGTSRVDDHGWAGKERTPGAARHAEALIREAIDEARDRADASDKKRARLLCGRQPDTLLAELFGTTRAADEPLDWKAALEAFVAHVRAPVRVRHRPNRRFPERIFEIPGRAYRLRPIDRPHLLVAIDTSMSMSDDELAEIARQLLGLADRARLTIAECDAAVSRVYPFEGAITTVKGRGGTDLRPPLEPAFLARLAVDGVVYFTDGVGPHPDAPPPVPVLFVLSKPLDFGCPFGLRARLPRARITGGSTRSPASRRSRDR